MTVEPKVRICLALQPSTVQAIDALAARLSPDRPNRSGTVDAVLRYFASHFTIDPVNESTADAA
jgi:hypothetical protein